MQVEINGKKEAFETGITLKELLVAKGVNPNVVACELNLSIIKRAQLDQVTLKDGDTLEIIQMIGGG